MKRSKLDKLQEFIVDEAYLPTNEQVMQIDGWSFPVDTLIKYSKNIKTEKLNITSIDTSKEVGPEYNDSLLQSIIHHARIQNSDLRYPILVTEDYMIIDGRPRFMKAVLKGWEEIKVKVISYNELNTILVDSDFTLLKVGDTDPKHLFTEEEIDDYFYFND